MAKVSVMTEKIYAEKRARLSGIMTDCFGPEPVRPTFIKPDQLVNILNSAGEIGEDREYVLLDPS